MKSHDGCFCFLCQGQTPFDVADEGLVEHLEMLQKKQSVVSLRLMLFVTACGPQQPAWVY